MQSGLLHEDDVAEIKSEIDAEIADAVAFAEGGTDEPVDTLDRMFVTSPDRPAPPDIAAARQNGRDHLSRGCQSRDHRCNDA